MGALLALLLLGGLVAWAASARRDAAEIPMPAGMIGTLRLQIMDGDHRKRALVTRHGQGWAWYLQNRKGEVLDQGNEEDSDGAILAALGAITPRVQSQVLEFLFDQPRAEARIRPLGDQWEWEAPWGRGTEPTRADAVRVMFEARPVVPPAPTPDDPLEGAPAPGPGMAAHEHVAGLSVSPDKQSLTVVDLEQWVDEAGPHVLAAGEAGLQDPREIANAVFGVMLDAQVGPGFTIDGEPWEAIESRLAADLAVIFGGEYVRVAPPERWVAAGLVGKVREEPGWSGVHENWTWVVRPWQPPEGLAMEHADYQWLVFEGPRGPDNEAAYRGLVAGTMSAARDEAHQAIEAAQ